MRLPRPRTRRRVAVGVLAASACLLAAGCGSSGSGSAPAATSSALDPGSWDSVLAAAKGQTVSWSMYGGDDVLNGFVTGYVADRLAEQGVTLDQVKITDAADVVDKLLAEKQAGKDSGSVDAIWINGENFATGAQADLWYCGYDRDLPNAKFVDFDDPGVQQDFGRPVEGCEAVWQRASSALVYDSAKMSASDVASVPTLFAWAKAHPGQLTYPAPPDFTGSMAVRTFLYSVTGGPEKLPDTFDKAAYEAAAAPLRPLLQGIEPALWRQGQTYPTSQSAVEKLYADGEIAAFFTYGPGAVADQVTKGIYPASTREAVLDIGNISNYSFVAVPANAPHRAAALVLANVLQDPKTQLALYKAEGAYPGIDLQKTSPEVQRQFAAVAKNPSVLSIDELTRNSQPELSAAYVKAVEQDWKRNVLQR